MKIYLTKLVAPVSEAAPVGERLVDDPVFEFIEDQMMKVGSLAHASIQWQQVETSTVELLHKKTKDIKLLVVLMQCLQRDQDITRFLLSMQVLERFMALFWTTAHPAPGDRGKLPRRRFFTMIMERALQTMEGLSDASLAPDLKTELEQTLKDIAVLSEEYGLPSDEITRLLQRISSLASSNSTALQVNQAPVSSQSTTRPTATSASSMPSVDTSNEKEVKQSLLKIADFMCETDMGTCQGLRLRRYAIWFTVLSAPDAKKGNETDLMPVAPDRVADYQDMLSKSGDKALWRKIENSLVASPFWLDGHYLSAQLAEKLGFKAAAQAIREEVASLIARLPKLTDLTFKGGAPFVSEATASWVQSQEQSSHGVSDGDWLQRWQEADNLAREAGFELALAQLNAGLEQAQEPRDQFYWRLLSADLLNKYGMKALAQQQYQQLLSQANQTSLAQWEPSLLNRMTSTIADVR
ncbi:type VI secretion system protein TssA [Motilimonas sp. E26]|uniref:type VI secretion system protein TssA n=1 Tax=Motilimonas sp. E26 TaxID=2865674 RepID=UPI001E2C6B62|nr:type VI secretion system protein TssA [Motilimonas sp. E26]MCE0559227.1 type VI secretion system protein TssA [Motilimonas sp. E26]